MERGKAKARIVKRGKVKVPISWGYAQVTDAQVKVGKPIGGVFGRDGKMREVRAQIRLSRVALLAKISITVSRRGLFPEGRRHTTRKSQAGWRKEGHPRPRFVSGDWWAKKLKPSDRINGERRWTQPNPKKEGVEEKRGKKET